MVPRRGTLNIPKKKGGKQMKAQILASLLTIGVAATMLGVGTVAYFSDTETSTGNILQAGTLDLILEESGGTSPITLTNMKPGDTVTGSITVTNAGSLAGSLYATSWYVESDGVTTAPDGTGLDMSDDDVAKMLLITAFTADEADILSQIPDTDGNGKITVYDMVNDTSGVTLAEYPSPGQLGTWYSYDTNMTADESHVYSLTIKFDTAAGNDYQGDGITLTFEFLLTQA